MYIVDILTRSAATEEGVSRAFSTTRDVTPSSQEEKEATALRLARNANVELPASQGGLLQPQQHEQQRQHDGRRHERRRGALRAPEVEEHGQVPTEV